MLTNRMGDDGFLRKFGMQSRLPVIMGDLIRCKGKVTDKYVKDGEHLVECEVWCENQRGENTAPGHATIRLPIRG